jgi:hypothetical protein
MKAQDILGFALKLPAVIGGVMGIVSKVKDAPKDAKVQAVIDSIPDSVALAEFSVGKDLLNDEAVKTAIEKVAALRHDLIEAEAALKAILVKKAA